MTNRGLSHRLKLTSNMIGRICTIGVCLVVAWVPVHVRGQADAQDRTQSLLDTHKEMDPANSDRALTAKTRRSETHIEQTPLPPPPGKKPAVNKKTQKQIHALQQQKKEFITQRIQVEKEKAAAAEKFVALDEKQTAKQANEAWDRTEAARMLHKLEVEEKKQAKTKKKTDVEISTAPLPPRSY